MQAHLGKVEPEALIHISLKRWFECATGSCQGLLYAGERKLSLPRLLTVEAAYGGSEASSVGVHRSPHRLLSHEVGLVLIGIGWLAEREFRLNDCCAAGMSRNRAKIRRGSCRIDRRLVDSCLISSGLWLDCARRLVHRWVIL